MLNKQIDDLLETVYKKANSYDPMKIIDAYDYGLIYEDIGPYTIGTRITSSRCTTIILDKNLVGTENILVPLHEIKHCLTDKGASTPFLRRMGSGTPVTKREYEANYFALHAMIAQYKDELENATKYQVCDFFELDYDWARFI